MKAGSFPPSQSKPTLDGSYQFVTRNNRHVYIYQDHVGLLTDNLRCGSQRLVSLAYPMTQTLEHDTGYLEHNRIVVDNENLERVRHELPPRESMTRIYGEPNSWKRSFETSTLPPKHAPALHRTAASGRILSQAGDG